MAQKYPMTATQQETALRKGWTCSKSGKWTKPKKFSSADQDRIDLAEVKRQRRHRGAD